MTTSPYLLSHSLQRAADVDPDQLAVISGDDSITYGQLADRSARFASSLAADGIGRGDRVAVYASKSVESVVAIHGTQWAGAIAVPIDPAAPPRAVKRIVEDADPRAVVCDARTSRVACELSSATRIGPPQSDDPARLTWTDVVEHEPASVADVLSEDPAYILYTSGSTGQPKGIVHSHRSGLRYAQLAASTYELSPNDRLANVAPFHFDQSTFELYASPVGGSTTVLIPEILLKFPSEVASLVASAGITVWYSVPTLLVQMLERGGLERHDLDRLRWVLFGGEVFPSDPLTRLMELIPAARFSNVYGPTEVNQCTHHHLDTPPAPGTIVPIGSAWGDTETRLVDEAGVVLHGQGPGSLEVRTATMMLGYWRRRDLTEASIVADYGNSGLMTRWYRTGDIVERDVNGVLTFLGRADRQVKVRGYRIELEAVEAALSNATGVVRSVVVVDSRGSDDVLVGVVEGRHVDQSTVLRELRQILPSHAVPSTVRLVSDLPRTRSGKVDARSVELMINREVADPGPFTAKVQEDKEARR